MYACSFALVVAMAATLGAAPAVAQEAGHIKVAKGAVQIERARAEVPATVGAIVQAGDVVIPGPTARSGITFRDNSLLSAGPNSVLAIDRFAFDSTTHQGSFESSLRKGTLAVVSGKLAKQSPDAMKVRTPAAILGVRGTEFLVRTGEPEGLTRDARACDGQPGRSRGRSRCSSWSAAPSPCATTLRAAARRTAADRRARRDRAAASRPILDQPYARRA